MRSIHPVIRHEIIRGKCRFSFPLKIGYFCIQITNHMEVRDSNGTILSEGDTVSVIKDLKVKGSSSVIKRGSLVKGIRLTDNVDEVEGRVSKVQMVLRTEFLKKA